MNRVDLIKQLERDGCVLLRHGGNDDIYHQPKTGMTQPVPCIANQRAPGSQDSERPCCPEGLTLTPRRAAAVVAQDAAAAGAAQLDQPQWQASDGSAQAIQAARECVEARAADHDEC